MSAAHEQLACVKRYLDRFKEIHDGIVMSRPSEYYIDDVYSFFENCHHLKDWIKNDNALSTAKQDGAQPLLDAHDELKLAADIANGNKHLVLTRRIHSAADPKFEQLHQRHFDYDPKLGKVSIKFTLEFQGKEFDCYDLAVKCVDRWEKYLATP